MADRALEQMARDAGELLAYERFPPDHESDWPDVGRKALEAAGVPRLLKEHEALVRDVNRLTRERKELARERDTLRREIESWERHN